MKNDMPDLEFLLDDARAEGNDRLPIILLLVAVVLALTWLLIPA